MRKTFARRAAALAAAMLMALTFITVSAGAVDISDFDPNPGAAHVATSVESGAGFAPQRSAPFTVALGDELRYTATTQLSDDAVKSVGLTLASPFELKILKITYLAANGEVLGRTLHDATDRKKISLAPEKTDVAPDRVDMDYVVRVVSTLSTGRSGMKNRLTVSYETAGEVVVESAPVYTNTLQLKIVDTSLPKSDPPKSSTGHAYLTVDTYPGQYLTGAKYILYKDEACEDPVFAVPSFRRYDVCPEDEYGATAVIETTGGPVDIVGLPSGTYWLQSIMPPDGSYGAPAKAVPVTCAMEEQDPGQTAPEPPGFAIVKYGSSGTKLALDYAEMKTTNHKKAFLVASACMLITAAMLWWHITHGRRKKNGTGTA